MNDPQHLSGIDEEEIEKISSPNETRPSPDRPRMYKEFRNLEIESSRMDVKLETLSKSQLDNILHAFVPLLSRELTMVTIRIEPTQGE